jgi:hypothetical protein
MSAGRILTVTTIVATSANMPQPSKVGIEPRGAALAIATGACLAAGYSLLQDHDVRRIKKNVAGGSLFFLGSYLFLRGSRFDDVQTAAVVAAVFSMATIMFASRGHLRFL